MKRTSRRTLVLFVLVLTVAVTLVWLPTSRIDAADHGEAPLLAHDLGADIADVYFFLDPSDNSKVILAMDVHGFIVPAENANMGFFDPSVQFGFQIENTGDAKGDLVFGVTFSKQTSRSAPQTATISLNGSRLFSAPTTISSATASVAPAPVVTTDPSTGISFFGGLVDDPFFFDIPAELRFRNSLLAGARDTSHLSRGRDSFAGYNITMIVLSIPAARLRGPAGDVIGLTGLTRRQIVKGQGAGDPPGGNKKTLRVDRMAIPAVNTVLIPFARKDEYNSASTEDDAEGRFAADIIATLTQVGTNATFINILASVAVVNGDVLRLNLSIPNTGTEGGNNAAAGFPNGRRPNDDVIDVLLTLISNGVFTPDNVGDNDAVMRDVFPFFAPPTQPFPAGVTDDRTRN